MDHLQPESPPQPTPTTNAALPFRPADFSSLSEALDYAARGETGLNFYDVRGRLATRLSYAELRQASRRLAAALRGRGLSRGDRVAIVAEMGPDFVTAFFACQYAGLTAVPLPALTGLGSRDSYVETLRGVLRSSRARLLVAADGMLEAPKAAAAGLGAVRITTVPALLAEPVPALDLAPLESGDISHIQYSSGSTRDPRGIRITQDGAMANARSVVCDGLRIGPGDRGASWLPFYHDMGLIGFLVITLTAQLSVDYLSPESFARRPMQWLQLISRNRCTIAFSPDFGYELCARRARDLENLDLSCWRVAGIGGERIRERTLTAFARTFAPAGFRETALLPSYGLAEATLAVTFETLDAAPRADRVARQTLARDGLAQPTGETEHGANSFIACGTAMPGYEVDIRDSEGHSLGERRVGRIFVAGPSLMAGYDGGLDDGGSPLTYDGWLDTGDLGYLAEGQLFVTGRQKDLIIVAGRNILPQDLEWHAEHATDELRSRDAAAFPVLDGDGREVAVLLVQLRVQDPARQAALCRQIHAVIFRATGIDCRVVPVPARSLPFTSSGKLSRARARQLYLAGAFDTPVGEAVASG